MCVCGWVGVLVCLLQECSCTSLPPLPPHYLSSVLYSPLPWQRNQVFLSFFITWTFCQYPPRASVHLGGKKHNLYTPYPRLSLRITEREVFICHFFLYFLIFMYSGMVHIMARCGRCLRQVDGCIFPHKRHLHSRRSP